MRPTTRFLLLALVPCSALVAVSAACQDSNAPGFDDNLDLALCNPASATFSLTIDNPFFPLAVGTQLVFDDSATAEHLEITVLNETLVVDGVTTRVVQEEERANGDLVEISRNFFAQAGDGTVCYFGEEVDIYEGGVVVSHEGAWKAGVSGARPGIIMPATPAVGMKFRQEVAVGVAEDRAEITAINESITVPAGTFTSTVRFVETTPLEPGTTSAKVFASGVGYILDNDLKLTAH